MQILYGVILKSNSDSSLFPHTKRTLDELYQAARRSSCIYFYDLMWNILTT